MRRYELMLVVRPDFPAEDEKKVKDLIKKTVGEDGIALKNVTVIGKKNLAFPIKKMTEGVYVLADLEAKAVSAAAIEREVKMGDEVLRYLLSVKED